MSAPSLRATVRSLALLAFVVIYPVVSSAQSVSAYRRSAEATTTVAQRTLAAVVASGAIAVDGRLDEAAWRIVPVTGDFTQQFPDVQLAPTQKTEVRVMLDESALYVAMRLIDSGRDSIVAPLARRDFTDYSDWAYVLIDSYKDRRTAFRFAVNPSGVQKDAMISGDQEWSEDLGWDAVWSSATARDSSGWTAEFRIPLSQLRFAATNGTASSWGIQFGRHLARRNERSYWSPVVPTRNGFVSQFGDLNDLRIAKAARRLEVMPYSLAQVISAPSDPGNPFYRANASRVAFGADLKVGVTSDLTLTATINPDFGQVEADPSEVNLSGIETFLSERRPFFVEGSDLFLFNMTSSGWINGRGQLFYSRRIGRTPQGNDPDGARFVDRPSATRLLGALKLSGKTRGGWSLGALSAVTDAVRARASFDDGTRDQVVLEPRTHYGAARISRDFEGGESALGAMVTTVHRDNAIPTLRNRAVVGGFDARRRFGNRKYVFSGNVLGSLVGGSTEAIIKTQRSSVHLYQRPDADYVDVDSTRTSLSGLSGEMRLVRAGGGNLRWGLVGHLLSPGFEANDLGFHARSDLQAANGWMGWETFTPSRVARNWSVWTNVWSGWTFGGERQALGHNIFASADLQNYWTIEGDVVRHYDRIAPLALRGGPGLRHPGRIAGSLRLSSDERKFLIASLNTSASRDDGGEGHFVSIAPQLAGRFAGRMQLSLSPALSRWRNPQQFVEGVGNDGSKRYVVGDVTQSTASVTARVNYAFSPRLTVQFYAQPFVSAGEYRRFGEVVAPRAATVAGRVRYFAPGSLGSATDGVLTALTPSGGLTFDQPDYTFGELRSNAVVRWEYRPGSALFVVWSQGRSIDGDPAHFDVGRQADALMSTPGTNVLLVKMSHWLGR